LVEEVLLVPATKQLLPTRFWREVYPVCPTPARALFRRIEPERGER
jgi:hypothetical protein